MSDDINKIKIDFKEQLDFELKSLKYRIGLNIQNNKPISEASGKTRKDMRVEVNEFDGILWGRKDFEGLEFGNSPSICNQQPYSIFKKTIYTWSIKKKIEFTSDKRRVAFANYVAAKIQKIGTRLYREGGRKDIYTNEIEKTTENVAKKAVKTIIEHKLL